MVIRSNSFFAVQASRHRDLSASVFLQGAAKVGITFSKLDFLDTFTMGALEFARFQADLINPWPVLDHLFAGGRAVVGPGGFGEDHGGYVVHLTTGRTGKVGAATMHAVPRALRTFRGTAVEHWQRQFSPAP